MKSNLNLFLLIFAVAIQGNSVFVDITEEPFCLTL